MEADIVAHTEHAINAANKDNVNGLSQMFNGGKAEIRTICGHNMHEDEGRTQQGGTSLMLYGPLIDQYNFKASWKDDVDLGRCVVMVF